MNTPPFVNSLFGSIVTLNILLKIIFNVTIDPNNEFTKGGVFLPGLAQDI